MKKKLLSLITASIMAFGCLGITVFADGTAPALTGLGTQASPYLIDTVTSLGTFRDYVNLGNDCYNVYFKLTDDINLQNAEWTPIGQSTVFNGKFNGNGHTVKNLTITDTSDSNDQNKQVIGFFGTAGSAAEKNMVIENLTIENVTFSTNSSYVRMGAVTGQGYTGSITNCHLQGDIHITAEDRHAVGGINGFGYATITDCSVIGNNGSYIHTGNSFAGGIVGHLGEGSSVSGCYVENIEITGFVPSGIIGSLLYGSTVSDCCANGVTVSGSYASGAMLWNFDTGSSTITNVSVINSTITGTSLVGEICAGGGVGTLNTNNVCGLNNTVNGNTSGSIVATVPEAKIGNSYYSTLAAAFAGAAQGDTVTLLKDITVTEQINIDNQNVLNDITFDGNGKTITSATTSDPSQSGGSLLYFGNPNASKWCIDVKIHDLTITGTARFAIFLCGGTSSALSNVNISGNYLYDINFYGTHGGTLTNCNLSNSLNLNDGNENGSAIWANVQTAYPIILNNTTISSVGINKYTSAVDYTKAKIFVNSGSTVNNIYTYYDESFYTANNLTPDCCFDTTGTGKVNNLYYYVNNEWKKYYTAAAVVDDTSYETIDDAITAATTDNKVVTVPVNSSDDTASQSFTATAVNNAQNTAGLEITTDFATVKFNPTAIGNIYDKATTESKTNITVKLENKTSKTSTITETAKKTAADAVVAKGGTVYDVTLSADTDGSDNVDLGTFFAGNGGSATVTLPVPDGMYQPKVYYVANDGTKTDMNAVITGNTAAFETTHFSTYTVENSYPDCFDNLLTIVNMNKVQNNSTWYYPVEICTGIDSLHYKKVGFKIQAVKTGENPQNVTKESSTVYSSITVTDSNSIEHTYTPTQFGASYLFGQRMLFDTSNWANSNTTVYVTPFAVDFNDAEILGNTTEISDATVKVQNSSSSLFKEGEN